MRKVQNSVMNMVNKGGNSLNTEKNNSTAYFGPKKDMNTERNKLFNNTEIPFNKLPVTLDVFVTSISLFGCIFAMPDILITLCI